MNLYQDSNNSNTISWDKVFTPAIRRIGAGHCGSVWACPYGTSLHDIAIKREDGSPRRSLRNEFSIHSSLIQMIASKTSLLASAEINIPSCYGVINDKAPFWPAILLNFPPGHLPCKALLSERIPPMQKEVRELLIDLYCPPKLRTEVAADPRNEDCIIRVYLGRRRRKTRSMFSAFSLRNFILHADQMEELGLNLGFYACLMGEAVAWMHWRGRMDGNDVEFVLAPSRDVEAGRDGKNNSVSLADNGNTLETTINDTKSRPRIGMGPAITHPKLGSHALWILDFDCCRPLLWNQLGVQQAVAAFLRNDPYFPRPGSSVAGDQANWEIFHSRYLEVSKVLLTGQSSAVQKLPEEFVDGIIRDVKTFRGANLLNSLPRLSWSTDLTDAGMA